MLLSFEARLIFIRTRKIKVKFTLKNVNDFGLTFYNTLYLTIKWIDLTVDENILLLGKLFLFK